MTVAACDLVIHISTLGILGCAVWAIVLAITDEEEEEREQNDN